MLTELFRVGDRTWYGREDGTHDNAQTDLVIAGLPKAERVAPGKKEVVTPWDDGRTHLHRTPLTPVAHGYSAGYFDGHAVGLGYGTWYVSPPWWEEVVGHFAQKYPQYEWFVDNVNSDLGCLHVAGKDFSECWLVYHNRVDLPVLERMVAQYLEKPSGWSGTNWWVGFDPRGVTVDVTGALDPMNARVLANCVLEAVKHVEKSTRHA